jgi:glycosyltransferase involved in cell wall biosynthesis
MKLLIDHQAFSIQQYGGISRIFTELIKNKNENVVIQTPHFYLDNEYFTNLKYKKHISIYKFSNRFFSRIIKNLLPIINNLYTWIYTSFQSYDIYLPSYYDIYLLNKIKPTPMVLFVYDMIHEKYPEFFSKSTVSSNKFLLMKEACKIIAISHNTKNDILELYPQISSEKIEVIHLSDSLVSVINEKLLTKIPHEYILYVGTRKNYKNFTTLYKAYKSIHEEYPHIKLLCIGGGNFSRVELKEFEMDSLNDCIIQLNVDDSDLYTVYNRALVFVFPSLYEGFGIPVIEAMKSGCPIILGRLSSFPEIAEEAGIYCNITNPIELSTTILKVIQDKVYRNEFIARGKVQSEKFSWSKTAEKTFQVCQSVIKDC